jgi:hypothetical protein
MRFMFPPGIAKYGFRTSCSEKLHLLTQYRALYGVDPLSGLLEAERRQELADARRIARQEFGV